MKIKPVIRMLAKVTHKEICKTLAGPRAICRHDRFIAGNMLFNKRTIIYLYNYYYVLVYSNRSVSNILYIKTKKNKIT